MDVNLKISIKIKFDPEQMDAIRDMMKGVIEGATGEFFIDNPDGDDLGK